MKKVLVKENSILDYSKNLINNFISNKDIVIDMTVGNGFDTLYLANKAKFVIGFDIQVQAIDNTTKLLNENNLTNYKLYLLDHSKVLDVLPNYINKIKLVIYNLGYLPKGNKTIMTNHNTTLESLKQALLLKKDDGKIFMVFYPHPEGKKEAETILNYLDKSNIDYVIYQNTLKDYAPFLLVI